MKRGFTNTEPLFLLKIKKIIVRPSKQTTSMDFQTFGNPLLLPEQRKNINAFPRVETRYSPSPFLNNAIALKLFPSFSPLFQHALFSDQLVRL